MKLELKMYEDIATERQVSCLLDGRKLSDFFSFGQVDQDGKAISVDQIKDTAKQMLNAMRGINITEVEIKNAE